MQIGDLNFKPITENLDLVAKPIQEAVGAGKLNQGVYVAAIDPELADTATFCATYNSPSSIATNCIIIEAKRADKVWYAACLILADDMIDANGKVRRQLDARKTSFAPKNTALELSGMEYGGITPLGLPPEWPILVDERVLNNKQVVIGGGIRGSKIVVDTQVLKSLHNTTVLDITK